MSRTSENSELRKLHPFRTSVTLTLSLTRVNLNPGNAGLIFRVSTFVWFSVRFDFGCFLFSIEASTRYSVVDSLGSPSEPSVSSAPLAGRAAARIRTHGAIQRRQRGARCASRGPAARSPRAPRTRSFDARASFSRPSRRGGILTPSRFAPGRRRRARAAVVPRRRWRAWRPPGSSRTFSARARGPGLPSLFASRDG